MIRRFVSEYVAEVKTLLDTISLDVFEKLVDRLKTAFEQGGTVYVMGNGGSGATASHFVCDMNKSGGRILSGKIRCACLNDNLPSILAYANDISFDDIFVKQLENFLSKDDVVMILSASGNSPNIVKALEFSRLTSVHSVALTGFKGGQAAGLADISLVVPSTDIQKIEDVHLMWSHMIIQIFRQRVFTS